MRARSLIAYAQGVLAGRYGLSDATQAFDLLRGVSQRRNIKLHQIAAALTSSAPPAGGAQEWFPGRTRTPAPSLRAVTQADLDAGNLGAVLTAALERVLDIVGGQAGNVQLAEDGALRLERHHAHPRLFTDYFAFVDHGTSCSQAAADLRQVTVRNIAEADDIFDDATRQLLLDTGSRACHSVPLAGPDGTARGVISSHHVRPLAELGRNQLEALEQVQHLMGTYLHWHHHNVVRDALEDLHRTVLDHAGPRGAVPGARARRTRRDGEDARQADPQG
ncbi:ANTAR domain-containing protein [Streptomyces sp. SID14478]|nr:ANTAR domain-containing protein [Streptomyces sp. SID14478]NEB75373.1 ANTAR domain-containing protein [Streptomyces sp. SID14478]